MDCSKAVACAAVVLVAVAACSGGSDDRAQTVSTPPGSPAVTAAPASPSSDAESSRDAHSADAETALLTVQDMPTGWSPQPSDSSFGGGDTSFCQQQTVGQFEPVSEASRQFSAGNMGPFAAHAVAVFEDGQAQQALDAMLDAVDSCDQWREYTNEGLTTHRISPVSFPIFGDQTVAVRLTTENEMMSVTGDMIAWRRDDALSVVFVAAVFDSPDAQQVEQIVTAADQRLQDLQ
jgi:hypothetical protein